MKIGILYPRSNAYPGMMADFMDGIKAALKHAELYDHIHLFSKSIGFGGNERRYIKKQKSYCFVGRIFLYLFNRQRPQLTTRQS
jgi:hypothetical protein